MLEWFYVSPGFSEGGSKGQLSDRNRLPGCHGDGSGLSWKKMRRMRLVLSEGIMQRSMLATNYNASVHALPSWSPED